VQVERIKYKQSILTATVGDVIWVGAGPEPSLKKVSDITVVAGLKTIDVDDKTSNFIAYTNTSVNFEGSSLDLKLYCNSRSYERFQ